MEYPNYEEFKNGISDQFKNSIEKNKIEFIIRKYWKTYFKNIDIRKKNDILIAENCDYRHGILLKSYRIKRLKDVIKLLWKKRNKKMKELCCLRSDKCKTECDSGKKIIHSY